MKKSVGVYFSGNIVYKFKPIGMSIESSNNITFDKNVVGHIHERASKANPEEYLVDTRCGICMCSIGFEAMDKCRDLHITDNIVAGAAMSAYTVIGSDCTTAETDLFRGNIAHSVYGSTGGIGALIY